MKLPVSVAVVPVAAPMREAVVPFRMMRFVSSPVRASSSAALPTVMAPVPAASIVLFVTWPSRSVPAETVVPPV
ncbi:hypothetical protein [Methylobacterium sp. sgz302003]|uniref:hypothetical protein n=1 Tax=Methylobacterium oryzisoli TaxID=3385502 RepID=UPI0039780546